MQALNQNQGEAKKPVWESREVPESESWPELEADQMEKKSGPKLEQKRKPGSQ